MRTHIYGFWRLYIAIESPSAERRWVTRAWIIELAPPYRKGRGFRFRVGDSAIQIGHCRTNPRADALRQLGGFETEKTIEEISQWGLKKPE